MRFGAMPTKFEERENVNQLPSMLHRSGSDGGRIG